MPDPSPEIIAARLALVTARARSDRARQLHRLADEMLRSAADDVDRAECLLEACEDPLWLEYMDAQHSYRAVHAAPYSPPDWRASDSAMEADAIERRRRRDTHARAEVARVAFDAALPPASIAPANLLPELLALLNPSGDAHV